MGEEHDLGTDPEVIDLRSVDRRDALKKGALVAGAAIWATPIVQTVGISRAAAQDPSTVIPTTSTTMDPVTTTTTSTSSTTTTSTPGSTTTTTTTPSSTTTTSSSSTTTTTKPPVHTICNIQIVVRHNHCLFGLLYDGHRWIQWSDRAPDAVDCIRFFGQANQVDASWLVAVLFTIGAKVTKVSNALWRLKLPLPKGVEFVAGWAQVGDASLAGCTKAVVTATTIDFSAS